MVTYKTLEDYLNKCKKVLDQLEIGIDAAQKNLRYLEDSRVAIQAQIETLEQLMDVENNPSHVEIPTAGDKIAELFDKRMGDDRLPDETEMRKLRQEGVYKSEAMEIVEQLDEANSEDNNGEGS